MYNTKIHDIDDLWKRWCKLGLTLTKTLWMLWLTSGVTIWDHVCMLVVVWWTLWTHALKRMFICVIHQFF